MPLPGPLPGRALIQEFSRADDVPVLPLLVSQFNQVHVVKEIGSLLRDCFRRLGSPGLNESLLFHAQRCPLRLLTQGKPRRPGPVPHRSQGTVCGLSCAEFSRAVWRVASDSPLASPPVVKVLPKARFIIIFRGDLGQPKWSSFALDALRASLHGLCVGSVCFYPVAKAASAGSNRGTRSEHSPNGAGAVDAHRK